MFPPLDKAIKQLRDRQNEMAHSVMKTPPPDYAGLMKLVGEYEGIEESIQLIEQKVKGGDL